MSYENYQDMVAMEGIFSRFFGHPDTREEWEKDKDFHKHYYNTWYYGTLKAHDMLVKEIEKRKQHFGSEGTGNPYAYMHTQPWYSKWNKTPAASYPVMYCTTGMITNCYIDDLNAFYKWMSALQASMQPQVDRLTHGVAKISVKYGDTMAGIDTVYSAAIMLEVDVAAIYREWRNSKFSDKEPIDDKAKGANEAFFFSTEKSQAKVIAKFDTMESYMKAGIECFETCITAINDAVKAITAGKNEEAAMKAIAETMMDKVKEAGMKWAPDQKYMDQIAKIFKANSGKRYSMAADFKQDNVLQTEKGLVVKCQVGGEYYTRMANVVRNLENLSNKMEAAYVRYHNQADYKISALGYAIECWKWVNRNVESLGYNIEHGVIRAAQKDGFSVDPNT